MIKPLFACTIFSSAFLLFLVQPLISKQILPWFGGSAAVWATCMVFFQVVLLLGYAYSDWVARHLSPRRQMGLHLLLLTFSLFSLPIVADAAWKPAGHEDPAVRILLLLAATIGLPYFLLSTTGPLLQSWISRTSADTRVYRYFSLSNLVSLVALLSYPFVIEPRAALLLQAQAWSIVYVVFVTLCAAVAVYFGRHAGHRQQTEVEGDSNAPGKPTTRNHVLWLALSAMGTWLLLAVTNHITQNIAAVPFLWILPLSIYLLTFILCFESDRWYVRSLYLAPAGVVLALCAYGLQGGMIGFHVKIAVPLYVAGLFLGCMFLHGELARMRPSPRYLTRFYLMVSLGGALGGIAVGLIAPRVLPAYYELGIGLVIVALLAAVVFHAQKLLALGAGMLALLCGYLLWQQVTITAQHAHRVERNFYGSLRVMDSVVTDELEVSRGLYHGAIRHGAQFLSGQRRREATTYYGQNSGVGLALMHGRPGQKKVGLVGLGAGTLAAYGRPGDVYRFYEINPQVVDIARTEFSYLRDSQARIETVLGDARLALERETPQDFDVLAVDAFSGDAIPVHLMTREAMQVYLRHMKPDGIIAIHVTNRFLSLAPVVDRLAQDLGLHAVLVRDSGTQTTKHKTDWVLVARNPHVLQQQGIRTAAVPIESMPGVNVWTDDFNNLFEVLK